MKRTRLTAILVGFAAVGVLSQDAFARERMYHPGLGRFMQRDPVGTALEPPMTRNVSGSQFTQRDPTEQYQDGLNLYQYVGSNPVGYTDPFGLWRIKREGSKLAGAEAEKDDTVEKLAKDIGLDPAEFQKWLTLARGQIKDATAVAKNLRSLKATDIICVGEKVEIPNTVLAYWAGEIGGFGKWWVMWGTDVGTLKERGFNVPEHQGWAAKGLETEIQTATGAKELHGIFFWGHGYDKTAVRSGGVLTDSDKKEDAAYYSSFASWNAAYKPAFGVLFACYTQNARSLFSTNAVFWGSQGVLVPHGLHLFGPTIDSLLPPGAQGTKK